jgi:uncharacterized protein (TIGR03066 family)
MRVTFLPGLALLIVLLSSAPAPSQAAKYKELIVGKWDIGMSTIFEYRQDGTMKMTLKKTVEINGKYKFISDDTIEVEITVGDKTRSNRLKIAIKDDTMTTTDPDGKQNILTRVK